VFAPLGYSRSKLARGSAALVLATMRLVWVLCIAIPACLSAQRASAQACVFELDNIDSLIASPVQLSSGVECGASIVQTGSVALNIPILAAQSNSSLADSFDAASAQQVRPDLVETPGALFTHGLRLRPPSMSSTSTNALQVHSDHAGDTTVSVWVFWPHFDHPKRAQTIFSSSDFDSKNATNFQFGLTSPDAQQRYSQLCAGSTALRTRNAFETNQGCSLQALPTRAWTWLAVSINTQRILTAYVNAQRVFQVLSFGGAPRYESSRRNNGAAYQLGTLFNSEQTAFAGLFRDFRVHRSELSPIALNALYNQKLANPEIPSQDQSRFAQVDGFVRRAQLYASLVGSFAVDQSARRNALQGEWSTVDTADEALSEGALLGSDLQCPTCEIPVLSFANDLTQTSQTGYSKSMWLRLMRLPSEQEPESIQLASNLDITPSLYRNIRLYEFQQHRLELLRDTRVCAWHDSGVNSELDGVSSGSQLRVCTEPLSQTYLQTWVHVGVSFNTDSRTLEIYLNAQPMASSFDACGIDSRARKDFNMQTCFERSALGLLSQASDWALVRNIAMRDGTSSQYDFAAQFAQQSQNQ
jgi:hypothetical protein